MKVRGQVRCPFRCTYCFWGAATNAKVNKFSQDRVLDEITWLCENKFMFIMFADANFGIIERDVEIALHLAECKRRTGFPHSVLFNSSKNTPERVTQITKIFGDAGLMAAQPVSMQTMSEDTLIAVERDNISSSSYTRLQEQLNDNGLQSFVEMIWPLPGENLSSFMGGLDQLCRMKTDSFVVYPLMLINNVKMETQRGEYGLVTVVDPDPNSEAEIVIATRDVSHEDYLQGLNLTYNLTCLYSFKALRFLMDFLDQSGRMTYSEVATQFWRFVEGFPEADYVKYINSIASSSEFQSGAGGLGALGGAIHSALHAAPDIFDGLLMGFLDDTGLLDDPDIRLRFELDLLNRPLIYSNTPILDKSDKLQFIKVVEVDSDTISIDFDPTLQDKILSILSSNQPIQLTSNSTTSNLKINYRTIQQIPFAPRRKLDFYHYHCQYKTRGEIRSIEPTWTAPTESKQYAQMKV